MLAYATLPGELYGVSYNGATGTCTSELFEVSVVEAPFMLELAKGAVERGDATAITAKLSDADFAGEATVALLGLPDGLACEPVTVPAGTEEFTFTIAATAEAPLGMRKNLVAEVVLPDADGDGVLTWKGGVTDLRVDKAPETAPPAPRVADAGAEPKPLSRLEKLRRRAKAATETPEDAPATEDER